MNENLDPRKQTQKFLRPNDTDLHRDQLRVVNVLRGQSKCESMDAVEGSRGLENRLKSLGPTTVDQIFNFIARDAQITINLTEATIKILLEDTHYRSTFETSTKGPQYLKLRQFWEAACFHDLYDVESITNFDRPKYGALNWLNCPSGVAAATQYGGWFLTLTNDIKLRNRVTLATGDTCGSRCLGVLDYCGHVLAHFSDKELAALGKYVGGQSVDKYPPGSYKEVQIHGELQLDRDFLSLHVPTAELGNSTAIEFCATFGLALIGF